ncbi:MAG: LPXTG cell wall anchor domain-containing protein [Streptococcus sp.]|nr:LPXTG cell wall anchor domain-containing protein [Streptococcus sp.]
MPNTGASTSVASALLGALAAVTGIGLLAKKSQSDDQESH